MELWGLGKEYLLPHFLTGDESSPENWLKPVSSGCAAQLPLPTSQQWFQRWEVRNPTHDWPVCIEGLTQQKDGLDEVTSYRTITFRQTVCLGRCISQQLQDLSQRWLKVETGTVSWDTELRDYYNFCRCFHLGMGTVCSDRAHTVIWNSLLHAKFCQHSPPAAEAAVEQPVWLSGYGRRKHQLAGLTNTSRSIQSLSPFEVWASWGRIVSREMILSRFIQSKLGLSSIWNFI